MLKIVGLKMSEGIFDTLNYDYEVCKCRDVRESTKYKLYAILPDERKCRIVLYKEHTGTADGCCGTRGILRFKLISKFPLFYSAKKELLVALPEDMSETETSEVEQSSLECKEEMSLQWEEFFEEFSKSSGEYSYYMDRENFKCEVFSVDYVYDNSGDAFHDDFSNHVSGGGGGVEVNLDLFEIGGSSDES